MGFYILSYLCIFVFIFAVGHLVYRQIVLPVHVRWEIYPVQHETSAKLAHGGSYMEDLNWWEAKEERSAINELIYMAPEILLLRGVWRENRPLWWLTFPFHFGLYLLLTSFGLMVLYAVLIFWAPAILGAGTIFRVLADGLIFLTGWLGMLLGLTGSLGLLYKRLRVPELRDYSSFSDYFNLGFFLVFFLSSLATALVFDPWLDGAKAFTYGLLTGGQSVHSYIPAQSVSGAVALASVSLLIAYIPLTHMSHMFMKYFLYHDVKWDDAPNCPGSRIEAAIKKNLELKPTWQGKHIEADGKKSWQDIAASAPKEIK